MTSAFRKVVILDKNMLHTKQMHLCVFHVKWSLVMGRLRVADGGDGLQIWRVAVNTLNKQSRAADKGWFCRLEFERGANKP